MKQNVKKMYLGDFLGTLRYFGSCNCCRKQFTSTSDMVWVVDGWKRYCSQKCAEKITKDILSGNF